MYCGCLAGTCMADGGILFWLVAVEDVYSSSSLLVLLFNIPRNNLTHLNVIFLLAGPKLVT